MFSFWELEMVSLCSFLFIQYMLLTWPACNECLLLTDFMLNIGGWTFGQHVLLFPSISQLDLWSGHTLWPLCCRSRQRDWAERHQRTLTWRWCFSCIWKEMCDKNSLGEVKQEMFSGSVLMHTRALGEKSLWVQAAPGCLLEGLDRGLG